MAIIGSTQFLERIQFFNGERLFASDLQALEAFNREMRWLHNQSLHQAGVGSGFQVVGNIGDRQVTISPGYAIDSCGREIILTETQVLAIPPVADNGSGGSVFYDLTVSYPDDSELTPSETRDGICMPAGVVRLREEPVFCWVQLSDDPTNRQPVDSRLKKRITTALFIVLAQVEIFNCQLKHAVSTVQRRNARPPRQPCIACGSQSGGSAWTPSMIPPGPLPKPTDPVPQFGAIMYTLSVDTSSGRFQATPFYVARIVGPREYVDPTSGALIVADALINIPSSSTPTPPTPQNFTIQIFPVWSAAVTAATYQDLTNVINAWDVGWMGIES
jgi:hypothetical protein